MSVISPARTHPAINYGDLTADQQTRFNQLMGKADNTTSADEFEALMTALIAITGITGVRDNSILKCACSACYCDRIFDADAPDALVTEQPTGYNLGRLQCPDCADAHPRPVED